MDEKFDWRGSLNEALEKWEAEKEQAKAESEKREQKEAYKALEPMMDKLRSFNVPFDFVKHPMPGDSNWPYCLLIDGMYYMEMMNGRNYGLFRIKDKMRAGASRIFLHAADVERKHIGEALRVVDQQYEAFEPPKPYDVDRVEPYVMMSHFSESAAQEWMNARDADGYRFVSMQIMTGEYGPVFTIVMGVE